MRRVEFGYLVSCSGFLDFLRLSPDFPGPTCILSGCQALISWSPGFCLLSLLRLLALITFILSAIFFVFLVRCVLFPF